MTITIATTQTASLRDRLDRLMSATNALTDGAHQPLTHTLNLLDDIADQIPGLDITDWSHVWLKATADVENMHTERLAGRPFEAWGRQLKDALNILAGIIYRALGDDQPEESEDEPQPLPLDNGECSTCPCCSAEDCENGECLDDRAGAPKCPCTAVNPDSVGTVLARNGLLGYQVHTLRKGAPLPGGHEIADVQDYGSDTHLLVIDGSGGERYVHRHTEIRLLESGVVSLVAPEYAGWAAD
ncbi:hypothetical protein AB0L65_32930 [Nonomuraea sp. NPDC052116]|uniref:hypothetical protein n=1 Tax=Nonomuraea sp. NPDC052116 TaxID=3155665 RepID=UPI0034204952